MLGESCGLIFTNRFGGVSLPPYDSLNLAFRTGDNATAVWSNRLIVASEMGVPPERFIYLEQIHGIHVRRARAEDGGNWREPPGEALKKCDGSYTMEPLTVLAVLTADCLPIALADEREGFIAMVHAGWRGSLENIEAAALGELAREISFDPSQLKAVIGPGIGPCCYQVDEGRAALFVERYGDDSGVVRWGKEPRLDLYRANRINLLREGVKEENINEVGGCTCCDPGYFSFRREGRTGRQGAFACLRKRE